MPLLLDPGSERSQRRLEFLARRATGYRLSASAAPAPAKLKAQELECAAARKVEPTEAENTSLVRGHIKPELSQTGAEFRIEALGILLTLKRANKVIRKTE